MAEKYYSILTNRGKELEAQSSATGKPVIIKDFVVGDGNGQPVKPDPAQTKLAREVYRNAISALQVSPDQANQFIAQLILPVNVGGFVVREVGLLTDAGELYSVANSAAIEKPENGVSVNLQYRLAVSESANIELKAATGDGLFLRIDKNLSEIAAKGEPAQKSSREAIGVLDATTARKGLVQLSSATDSKSEALAATPKAVKAVNDELITVKKTLGTAASKDVQTSKDDITAGRVLVNGGALALRTTLAGAGRPLTDFNDLPANSVSFGYDNATNTPGFTGSVLDYAGSSGNYRVQLAAQYNGNGNRIAFRTRNGDSAGVWNAWGEIYHTRNKPSAADVGALSISGGTLNGNLTVKNTVQIGGIGNAILNIGDNDSGLRSSKDGQVDLWANAKMLGYWNTTTFSFTGQIIPGNYTNFDARYYTKTLANSTFQPKGNYTPAGQAYTKAESNARYVQNVRVGAVGTFTINHNVWSEAPAGAFMTGWYFEGNNPGGDSVHYRPIQINVNGAWRTITA